LHIIYVNIVLEKLIELLHDLVLDRFDLPHHAIVVSEDKHGFFKALSIFWIIGSIITDLCLTMVLKEHRLKHLAHQTLVLPSHLCHHISKQVNIMLGLFGYTGLE
jgi:hypothetical protein